MKRSLPSMLVMSGLLVALFAGAALAQNVITCSGSSICEGTPQNDAITGTDRAETILAYSGRDAVSAGAGPDTIRAGTGNDEAHGGRSDDKIFGGRGDDQFNASEADLGTGLSGGGGADRISGNAGADDIVGGTGRDRLYGGDQNDILDSVDDIRDQVVNCGPGRDIALVDFRDARGGIVKNCEEVQRLRPSTPPEERLAAAQELR